MFRALVQVASIKSFSGCHATTTLIQISTAKLSFLGSQVLDASPWILFRLWTVCSLESIAFEKKNLNKIQFNYSQFNGLIYNSPHTKINSPFLLFWLMWNLIIISYGRISFQVNSNSEAAILPSSCLNWIETRQSILTRNVVPVLGMWGS